MQNNESSWSWQVIVQNPFIKLQPVQLIPVDKYYLQLSSDNNF